MGKNDYPTTLYAVYRGDLVTVQARETPKLWLTSERHPGWGYNSQVSKATSTVHLTALEAWSAEVSRLRRTVEHKERTLADTRASLTAAEVQEQLAKEAPRG